MKDLTIISVVPIGKRFYWEVCVFLNNLRERNLSDKAHILVFIPHNELQNPFPKEWKDIRKFYPEVQFFFYEDLANVIKAASVFNYIPILRPASLEKHFKRFPELKDNVIFYCDSDILLMDTFNVSLYLEDDINYLSDTKSYLDSDYIDGKISQVEEKKLEDFKKIDPLQKMGEICGISRDIIVANKEGTGGAQYILKNIDSKFWTDVFNHSLEIRMYLSNLNQRFMKGKDSVEKENNGYQSWCADMWAVLYNLWQRGYKTETPKSMDFAWSTDKIDKLNEVSILHNAGVTGDSKFRTREKDENGKNIEVESPAFYKGDEKYTRSTPFEDEDYLKEVINSPISSQYCNSIYAESVLNTKQNLKL